MHVDNTPEGIAAGIRRIQAFPRGFRAGAARLREAKLTRWQAVRATILARLAAARAGGAA